MANVFQTQGGSSCSHSKHFSMFNSDSTTFAGAQFPAYISQVRSCTSLIWVLGSPRAGEAPERKRGPGFLRYPACALSTPSFREPLGPSKRSVASRLISSLRDRCHTCFLTPMGFSHEGDDSSLNHPPSLVDKLSLPKQALCQAGLPISRDMTEIHFNKQLEKGRAQAVAHHACLYLIKQVQIRTISRSVYFRGPLWLSRWKSRGGVPAGRCAQVSSMWLVIQMEICNKPPLKIIKLLLFCETATLIYL